MKEYLKRYRIILETTAPVFIGSGAQLRKKDYIYNFRKKKAWIFDPKILYQKVRRENLLAEYEKFLIEEKNQDLYTWMKENNIPPTQYEKWANYGLDCSYAQLSKRDRDIQLFVKDPYGKPYIPGSSLKGALRTILLAYEAALPSGNRKLQGVCNEIQEVSRTGNTRDLRTNMGYSVRKLETSIFHTIEREGVSKNQAVCDGMSGLRVSDSTPAHIQQLILCQKLDQNIGGKEGARPIFRECLRPGVKLQFDMSIDTTLCPYTADIILEAVDYFHQNMNQQYKKFGSLKTEKGHMITIGGGAGYLSKTVTYNLYPEKTAIQVTANIMRTIFDKPKKNGRKGSNDHSNDVRLGVSPHTIKKTRYGGQEFQFGQCRISFDALN